MPYADPEKRRECQKKYGANYYQRNREKVIAAAADRKQNKYVGVCRFCGGPTHGDRPKKIPTFCAKPECRSKAYTLDEEERNKFREWGRLGSAHWNNITGWRNPPAKRPQVIGIDDLLVELDKRQRREVG